MSGFSQTPRPGWGSTYIFRQLAVSPRANYSFILKPCRSKWQRSVQVAVDYCLVGPAEPFFVRLFTFPVLHDGESEVLASIMDVPTVLVGEMGTQIGRLIDFAVDKVVPEARQNIEAIESALMMVVAVSAQSLYRSGQ